MAKKRKKQRQNIDQLPSGSWRARWTDELGRRHAEIHKDKDDAELALVRALVETEERKRGLRAMRPVSVKVRDVWEAWRHDVGLKKRSAVTDESFWRHHLEPEFRDLRVDALDSTAAARFITRGGELGLSVSSVHHHLTLLTTLLRFASSKGWLDRMPKIRKPRLTVDEANFRYLHTTEELGRVLALARIEGAMTHLIYATSSLAGLRLGEVCGLRRGDVDVGRRLIHVRRSFDGPTKSGRSRVVPILDGLVDPMRAFLDSVTGELLFTGTRGQMLRRDSPQFRTERHLGRVLERAGLARDAITFHGFRHTFASLFMMNGGDPFRLQRLLGHQSIETTQRYAHLASSAFSEDFERIPVLG